MKQRIGFETTVLFGIIISIIVVAYFIASALVSETIDGIAALGFIILIIGLRRGRLK
jgi:hypothetical protein